MHLLIYLDIGGTGAWEATGRSLRDYTRERRPAPLVGLSKRWVEVQRTRRDRTLCSAVAI
jgi:hypothetical protein